MHGVSEPAIPADDARARFFAKLRASLADNTFRKLVLARPHGRTGPQRIDVRRVALRGEVQLSFVHHHRTNDVTKNHDEAIGIAEIDRIAGRSFRNVHLFTRDEEWQLRCGKRGQSHLAVSPLLQSVEVDEAHDRQKSRWLDAGAPFLRELGVTGPGGRVVPAMARKWKQIDKFVEVFAGAIAGSRLAAAGTVRVADLGAGSGYLTFAVHDWLTRQGQRPEVVGVERRADLVQAGNDAVARLGLAGIAFARGDVEHHRLDAVDVLIALHACDTATDHALHAGMRAGAAVILAAPCCHREVRQQLRPSPQLEPVLRHGVHLGEFAEMLTDSVRAMVLEAHGYSTQVFEFVSLEHTAKNTMILATRRAEPVDPAPQLAAARELLQGNGVHEQCLVGLCAAGV
ncbi:MAG: SAM-dependent methyltransferase [Planctomycetota bacterium]